MEVKFLRELFLQEKEENLFRVYFSGMFQLDCPQKRRLVEGSFIVLYSGPSFCFENGHPLFSSLLLTPMKPYIYKIGSQINLMPKQKEMVFILRSIKIVLGDDKRRGLKPSKKQAASSQEVL